MATPITYEEFEDIAFAIADCIGSKRDRIELYAAQNARALILRRIFNDGKDASGRALPPYSAAYAKRRAKSGLSKKTNLQDSDQLRESMVLGKWKGRNVFGIEGSSRNPKSRVSPNRKGAQPDNSELSRLIEKNYGREIFSASEKESKQIVKLVEKMIGKELDKCIKRIPASMMIAQSK